MEANPTSIQISLAQAVLWRDRLLAYYSALYSNQTTSDESWYWRSGWAGLFPRRLSMECKCILLHLWVRPLQRVECRPTALRPNHIWNTNSWLNISRCLNLGFSISGMKYRSYPSSILCHHAAMTWWGSKEIKISHVSLYLNSYFWKHDSEFMAETSAIDFFEKVLPVF